MKYFHFFLNFYEILALYNKDFRDIRHEKNC